MTHSNPDLLNPQTGSYPTTEPSRWPVRALTQTRKKDGSLYHREPEVEAQVGGLCAMASPKLRRARLNEGGAAHLTWDDPARLREETLVYFAREFRRKGDPDAAGQMAELLIDRVGGHVARKIGSWRLTPSEAEECGRDLVALLCDAVFDCGPTAEFWEVRFWVCLDRKLYNLLEKRQATLDQEVHPGDAADNSSEGDGEGGIERLLAQTVSRDQSPDEATEGREVLALLTENERAAVYYCWVEKLPEESDDPARVSAAKLLGVTGRSVRNYLTRAKEKIARYQRGETAPKRGGNKR